MNKGDVILAPFPFTDLSQTKLRPAIVLWVDPRGNDVTICFVSSQNLTDLNPGELIIAPTDSEFQGTGLNLLLKLE